MDADDSGETLQCKPGDLHREVKTERLDNSPGGTHVITEGDVTEYTMFDRKNGIEHMTVIEKAAQIKSENKTYDIYVSGVANETLHHGIERVKTESDSCRFDQQTYPVVKEENTLPVHCLNITECRGKVSHADSMDTGCTEGIIPFQTPVYVQGLRTEASGFKAETETRPSIKAENGFPFDNIEDGEIVRIPGYVQTFNSVSGCVKYLYTSEHMDNMKADGSDSVQDKQEARPSDRIQSPETDDTRTLLAYYATEMGSTVSNKVSNKVPCITWTNINSSQRQLSLISTTQTDVVCTNTQISNNQTFDGARYEINDSGEVLPDHFTGGEGNAMIFNNISDTMKLEKTNMEQHTEDAAVEIRDNRNVPQWYQMPDYQPIVRLEKITNLSASSLSKIQKISTKTYDTVSVKPSMEKNERIKPPRDPQRRTNPDFEPPGYPKSKRPLKHYIDRLVPDNDTFLGEATSTTGQHDEMPSLPDKLQCTLQTVLPVEDNYTNIRNNYNQPESSFMRDVCERNGGVCGSKNCDSRLLDEIASCGNMMDGGCAKAAHTKTKPYTCNSCSYRCTCSSKHHLARNLNTHMGEKPYKCNTCGYRCSRKYHLTTHIRTHTGEKPYKCTICNYTCSQKGVLTVHVRTHTGEKPYICNICGYRCSKKHHLTTHVRTHTGEKPYKCTTCDYRCSLKHHLNIHVRTHTGEKPYKCAICDYRCSLKHNLTSHVRTHTGEKPYGCILCVYRCSEKKNLTRHVRTHARCKPYITV